MANPEKFPWEDEKLYPPSLPDPGSKAKATDRQDTTVPTPTRENRSPRGTYPPDLKTRVTLEAIREGMTQREISEKYGVPQPLISLWKKAAIERIQYKDGPADQEMKSAKSKHLDEVLAHAEITSIKDLCAMLRDTARTLERAMETLVSAKMLNSSSD